MLSRRWPSTSRSEDAAVLALIDLTRAADGSEYRVIGGNMTTFHGARREARIAPRSTADADAGIESSAAAATDLAAALNRSGYTQIDGSRFTRSERGLELVIDVLVPDLHAEQHNIALGPLFADAAPGLTLALSREATWVEYRVTLTTGEPVDLRLPLPDCAVAVVMKTLAWAQRFADKDAVDVFRLLDTWSQDLVLDEAVPLRRGPTVLRALDVLERNFAPPKGKALLLPKASQTEGRRVTSQFIAWVNR